MQVLSLLRWVSFLVSAATFVICINVNATESAGFSVVSAPPVTTSEGLQYFVNMGTVSAYAQADYDPEIIALAKSLKHDPNRIGKFVYNNIDTLPMFGLSKGAKGAYYDGNGTPFDQAQLVAHLLRVEDANTSQIEATPVRYVWGTVTLTGQQFLETYGISDADYARRVMADSGTPANIYGTTALTSATLLTVWVEYLNEGQWVSCVPFIKSHIDAGGGDLASEVSHNHSTLITNAGGQSGSLEGVPWVSGISEAGVVNVLQSEAIVFLNKLRTQYGGIDTNDLLEQEKIERKSLGQHLVATQSLGLSVNATWMGEIPPELRTKVSVKAFTINFETYLDEIYTERLTFRWVNYGFGNIPSAQGYGAGRPDLLNELLLYHGHRSLSDIDENFDYQNRKQYVVGEYNDPSRFTPTVEGYFDVELAINHPYPANSGAYADEVVVKKASYNTYTEVFFGYQGLSTRHVRRYERLAESDKERYDYFIGEWCQLDLLLEEQCFESANQSYAIAPFSHMTELEIDKDFEWRRWNSAFYQVSKFVEALELSRSLQHHSMGIMTGTSNGPNGFNYSGISFDVDTKISVIDLQNVAYARKTITATLSTFATKIEELSLAAIAIRKTDPLWVSTSDSAISAIADMLSTANAQILNYSPSNYNSSLLSGYDINTKAEINGYIANGYNVLAPKTYPSATNRAWIVAYKGDGTAFAHKIRAQTNNISSPFRKGGITNPQISDLQAEDFKRASVDKTHSVDMRIGQLNFNLPVNLSDGIGRSPNALSAQLSYQSNVRGNAPLAAGWKHNHDIYIQRSSSLMELLGETSPKRAASTFVAVKAMLDAENHSNAAYRILLRALIANWWGEGAIDNVATVNAGANGGQFFKLFDGSYDAPPTSNAILLMSNAPVSNQNLGDALYTLTSIDGTSTEFRRTMGAIGPIQLMLPVNKYMVQEVNYSTGAYINYQYRPDTGTLEKVVNHLGRFLKYEYPPTPNFVNSCYGGDGDTNGLIRNECMYRQASWNKLQAIENSTGDKLQILSTYHSGNIGRVHLTDYVQAVRHSQHGLFTGNRSVWWLQLGNGTPEINFEYDVAKLTKVFWFDSINIALLNVDYTNIGSLAGRVKRTVNAEGVEVKFNMNDFSSIMTDALGNETEYIYDRDGNLIELVEPSYEGVGQ